MKQYCQCHATRTAYWYCDRCMRALCPQCVDAGDMEGLYRDEKGHMCSNCDSPLQWLGEGTVITPFWQRTQQFFLYPISLHPFLLMIVLAVMAALLEGPGIIGLLINAVIWGISLTYAYAVLLKTAGGDFCVPRLSGETLRHNFGSVLKQFGIFFFVFFAAVISVRILGHLAGTLFIFFFVMFLPSMIMLLVTTNSLIQALNPIMFVTLAFRIGWGYLLMYFFIVLLGGAPALIAQYVIRYLPSASQIFIITMAQIYYTFIAYHLMGYVILQYRKKIGYETDLEDFKAAKNESGYF